MTRSFLARSEPLKTEEESDVARAVLSGGPTGKKRHFGTNFFKKAFLLMENA
jgi:hypothetical protein